MGGTTVGKLKPMLVFPFSRSQRLTFYVFVFLFSVFISFFLLAFFSFFRSQKVLTMSKHQVHPTALHLQKVSFLARNVTLKRRRLRIAMMSAMCLIAITALIVLKTFDTIKARDKSVKMKALQTSVQLSIEIADLVHRLQIERGTRVLFISSKGDQSVRKTVLEAAKKTDEFAHKLGSWPQEIERCHFNSRDTFLSLVNNHRKTQSASNCTIENEITFYSSIIANMFDWLFKNGQSSGFDLPQEFIGYQMLLFGKENTGIERALGGSYFIRGHFSEAAELLWFAKQTSLGKDRLHTSMQLMPKIKDIYDKTLETRNGSLLLEMEERRNLILSNKKQNASVDSGRKWFQLMTAYIDGLLQVQNEAGVLIVERIKNDVTESENVWALKLALFGFVGLLMPFFVGTVYTIQGYAAKLHQVTKEVHEEKRRADTLLYQMLPLQVAEQLKSGQNVTAEQFESVTVFFSDVVNFTQICAKISPMEVTKLLNRLYGIFDDHIDKYDVYKVETIGDAYMVVSGLPERNGHTHVTEIALMALHLVELLESLRFGSDNKNDLCVRIGIHTGQ